MASWKKYFSAVPSTTKLATRQDTSARGGGAPAGSGAKYASYLPEVYSGAPNRIERYIQYEQMDLDSEINKGLDIISDYSTQNYDIDQEPFTINYKDTMSETEVKLLKDMLAQWCSINRWQQRLWRAFRNTIKYGDQVFVRDPETFELYWVDMVKVARVIVNESEGKRPEQYIIRDINPNFQNMSVASKTTQDYYVSRPTGAMGQGNAGTGAGGWGTGR